MQVKRSYAVLQFCSHAVVQSRIVHDGSVSPFGGYLSGLQNFRTAELSIFRQRFLDDNFKIGYCFHP